jgi:drug/metabolite transporter (DMT)-like permease
MFYGASVGLVVLGIVFITQAETRLVGIFWLLAAAVLSGWEWRRRNRAGKPATSADVNDGRKLTPGDG